MENLENSFQGDTSSRNTYIRANELFDALFPLLPVPLIVGIAESTLISSSSCDSTRYAICPNESYCARESKKKTEDKVTILLYTIHDIKVDQRADGLFQYEGFEHNDRGSPSSGGYDGKKQSTVRVRETAESRLETRPVPTISTRVLSTRSASPTATLSEASSPSPWTTSRAAIHASGQIS